MEESSKKFGLTKKHWFGYMCGDWGGCMTFTLMSSIYSIFCTNALGIDPRLLGTLVIIWTIWDAINDPIMGAIMDKVFAKHQNPRGKFRPWILRSTPLLAVTAIAMWTVPTFFDGIALIVVLFATKILYEAAYTMFNIPMGSLLSAMSKNDVERASLSSARGAGSGFGNAIPGIVAPIIIAAFGERDTTGYMIVGVGCAVIGFIVCLFHYAMTEERVVVNDASTPENIKVTDILTVLAKNRPFVALCVHGVCNCAMQYGSTALGIYMYSAVYYDVTYQSISSILSAPFMVGAMVAVPFLCKKYDLQKLIRLSLLIGAAFCGGLFAMHMVMDVHPLVHGVMLGIGTGFSMVSVQMQWGLIGEAIDYNECVTGKRTEGSIYGTFNLARRIGQTIGQGFALYALGWIGYQGTAEVQTAGTIFGMKVLCVLVPGIFILGSWAAFKFIWRISPEEREKIKKETVVADGEISEKKYESPVSEP